MRTLIFILLSLSLCVNAQDRKISIHDPNFIQKKPEEFNHITDEYQDKFVGKWLYNIGEDWFAIILIKTQYNLGDKLLDIILGGIEYKKQNNVEEYTLDDISIKNHSIEGMSSSEYTLELTIKDKRHNLTYEAKMEMNPKDHNKATLTITKIKRPVVTVVKPGAQPPKRDTVIHFPKTMIMQRIR